MKKFLFMTLLSIFTVTACSDKEELTTQKSQVENIQTSVLENSDLPLTIDSDAEISETTPAETTVAVVTQTYSEYSNVIDIVETDNIYEYFNVPQPFPELDWDDSNHYFYDFYERKFEKFSGFFNDEVEKYLNIESPEISEDYFSQYANNKNCYGIGNNTLENTSNLYTFFRDFNVPVDTFVNLINEFNGINIDISEKFDNEVYLSDNFSEEEILALSNFDQDLINELFVTEYCIIKGNSIYSPEWIYCHSIEDYTLAGITPEDIKSKLPYYQNFPYTEEANAFLQNKFSLFY
ncbi:MAG: hypothetical protein LBM93_02215 [Oscillospiraceae bacterium]|jgi:hypothetical protein|nr:hypothetical protein [Oscillospiraceae bacterium]